MTTRKKKRPKRKAEHSVELTLWDPADYLRNEKEMVAYLQACIDEAENDPKVIAAALGAVARAYGMHRLARDTGITPKGLYKALSADGNPSLATVLKVMRALGMTISAKAA